MYFVYILKGTKYYVGYTGDLKRRITEHIEGKVISTSKLGTLELVGYYACGNKEQAMKLERKIKRSKNTKRWIGLEGFTWHHGGVV